MSDQDQEENLQAIAEVRRIVERWTRADWPRARCPVCGLGTIVVRGVLVRHEELGPEFYVPGERDGPGAGVIVQADARALPFRDGAVDAVFTSPPYNTGKDYPCDAWDTWADYYAFLAQVYQEGRRVARGPVAFVLPLMIRGQAVAFWPGHPWVFAAPVIRATESALWAVHAGKWAGAPFYIGTEVIVADQTPPAHRPTCFFVPQPWIGSPLRNRPMHPAAFAQEFVVEFLRLWPGVRSLLDPFGGTGTTALAAKRLGRVAFTVDLDARWTRVQVDELAQGSLFDWLRKEGTDVPPEGETSSLP